MRFDGAGGKVAPFHQGADQCFQALQLSFGWPCLIKIPNQTDANGHLILGHAVEMPAVELFLPTIPHADRAIAHAVAVAYEEVIGEAILQVAFFPVIAIESFQRPFIHGGMMDDDVAPAAGFHWRGGDALLDGCRWGNRGARRLRRGGLGGNSQPLPDVNSLFAAQSVARGQGRDGNAAAAGNVGQGILGFDDIDWLARVGGEASNQAQ